MSELDEGPSPQPIEPQPLDLRGNRGRVLDELRLIDSETAKIYEGVLRVLADTTNPIRGRMAGFALRELIVALGKTVGVVQVSGMSSHVNELRQVWLKVERNDDHSINGNTVEIAERIDLFFDKVDAEFPSKRERVQKTIRGLDTIRNDPPPDLDAARVGDLMGFDKNFNDILHGGESNGLDELEVELERFGDFLLSLRRPSVSSDLLALDSLIEGGPPSA